MKGDILLCSSWFSTFIFWCFAPPTWKVEQEYAPIASLIGAFIFNLRGECETLLHGKARSVCAFIAVCDSTRKTMKIISPRQAPHSRRRFWIFRIKFGQYYLFEWIDTTATRRLDGKRLSDRVLSRTAINAQTLRAFPCIGIAYYFLFCSYYFFIFVGKFL